jgi:hypothetical protein
MSDNFFSRWSRRKQGIDTPEVVQPLQAEPAKTANALLPNVPRTQGPAALSASVNAQPTVSPEPEPQQPLPTMEDVQQLTPTSDFQGFMRQGVPGEVRNAAMKKLFTDPHFNVMDGLDIYIGDYNTPDPLPAGMLEKMVGAQLLNLFPPKDPVAAEGSPLVAQSPPNHTDPTPTPQPPSALPACVPTEHDDPDLQLQPNHAPASPSSGQSTG